MSDPLLLAALVGVSVFCLIVAMFWPQPVKP